VEDYKQMVDIKSRVFDYSTHQLDPSLDKEKTSHRNVLRLSSYFTNPNHCAYVGRLNGKVIGYLQFVVNGKSALCTNGAIDPNYHGMFIGAKIYSNAFESVFDQGVKVITSGYCNQNIPARKIHQACNFKVKEHEIHLRK
jgi:ribosomal protein S18 acetylase RimI-like enzyme